MNSSKVMVNLWHKASVSGTKVAHAILDEHGGMKLVVLISPMGKKTEAHAFHIASGKPVKRLTKGAKEDIKKLKEDFEAQL